MSDLVVDTTRLREAASGLRLIGRIAGDTGARGERLALLVPAAGHPRAVQSLDRFLFSWTYGMALVAHEVLVSAAALDNVAQVLDATDAALAAGTDAPLAGAGAAPGPVPELPSPRFAPAGASPRWGDLTLTGAEVQLSSARRPADLVPGEPDDLHDLAAELRRFAAAAGEAGALLKGQHSPTDWTGRAAAAFAEQAQHLPTALDAAAAAFDGAGRLLGRHAEVLTDAHRAATQALSLWQDAERRSQIWRGVIPADGLVPNTSEDPGLVDMQRAADMVRAARHEVEESAVALASMLTAAADTAPPPPPPPPPPRSRHRRPRCPGRLLVHHRHRRVPAGRSRGRSAAHRPRSQARPSVDRRGSPCVRRNIAVSCVDGKGTRRRLAEHPLRRGHVEVRPRTRGRAPRPRGHRRRHRHGREDHGRASRDRRARASSVRVRGPPRGPAKLICPLSTA